eukprot:TRINITY_DN16995_c0_g1_i1.p1 TRINITY_DN16995_c0_g1~~TRINITY_DN16995_c0_g1_i1.p1  ORF type:complete len:279 (+),score=34.60 TRINITY_DN16995_c0_g1_i1:31-837(+)
MSEQNKKGFPLSAVYLSQDVYLVCMNHALTTEREEIMGLLLGDIKTSARGSVAFITAVAVLSRSDKRPDRVEIDPEQLTAAASEAERIAAKLKTPTRVIGWYHSHPHITVLPSHVDVRTQASYQLMDNGFVGLIVSCFNYDAVHNGKIQMIAFQSLPGIGGKSPEEITVPLHLVPALMPSPNTFIKMVQLQKILFEEGKATYEQAIRDKNLHPFTQIHHSAVYTKSLCRLLENGCNPLIELLEERQKQNEEKLKRLQSKKRKLLAGIS